MPSRAIRSARVVMTWARGVSFLIFLLAAVLPCPAAAQAVDEVDQIAVFGDSLSDSGNGFVLTGRNSTPPDYGLDSSLVPGAPYARGGHHLSNGATWIEQLARPYGLAGSVRPALLAEGAGRNYAIGVARARSTGSGVDLPVQVGAFLQDTGGAAPASSLYVVAVGGNDVRDAVSLSIVSGQAAAEALIDLAVASIRQSVLHLHALGARKFLVWNVPDVSLTPAARALDAAFPGSGAVAAGLSLYFNSRLAQELDQLAMLSGVEIVPLDVYQLLHAIVADPAAFGLSDATSACVTPGVPPFACTNPDEYLFWDGIHPTRRGHAIVADAAVDALGW